MALRWDQFLDNLLMMFLEQKKLFLRAFKFYLLMVIGIKAKFRVADNFTFA